MDVVTDNKVPDIAEKLASRADKCGISSLSLPGQVIVLVWSATGIICNGGFRYFYEGATNIDAVAAAFDTLELPDAARACRQSIKLFPEHILEAGYEHLREWLAQSNEIEIDTFFDPLNEVIWNMWNNNHITN
ncbi:MAG: DMP19 family protein [Janthinobacterium lividum]